MIWIKNIKVVMLAGRRCVWHFLKRGWKKVSFGKNWPNWKFAVAVNFGGKFLDILPKIYESAIVAAQRQHVISDTHVGDGSVLGAVESAIEQIKLKSLGMNVGGKIGVARWHEHLCVAVYVGVGVLRFNEVAVGMAHRVLRDDLSE